MSSDLVSSEQLELFVANIIDAAPKGDTQSMEFPLFSISSKVDTDSYVYHNKKTGASIEIIPNEKGRATIHDKDLLLYCFGQIAEAKNRGQAIGQKIHVTLYDYLKSTNKNTDGKSYKAVLESLKRLAGTTVYTTTKQGDSKRDKGFSFVSDYDLITDEKTGRMKYVELILPSILFDAVSNNQILTYSTQYFSLRSPYDRRLYELCRKHCGNQTQWEIGLENLYNKFGVKSPIREFRRKIKEIEKKQSIPDYFIMYATAKTTGTVEKIIVFKDKNGRLKSEKKAMEIG
ncbi:RepA [Gammaproteobacteria bacterium 42_54_T18]|nr:RepA [Gammaproteobacteria bacterium 42_54_T18]